MKTNHIAAAAIDSPRRLAAHLHCISVIQKRCSHHKRPVGSADNEIVTAVSIHIASARSGVAKRLKTTRFMRAPPGRRSGTSHSAKINEGKAITGSDGVLRSAHQGIIASIVVDISGRTDEPSQLVILIRAKPLGIDHRRTRGAAV